MESMNDSPVQKQVMELRDMLNLGACIQLPQSEYNPGWKFSPGAHVVWMETDETFRVYMDRFIIYVLVEGKSLVLPLVVDQLNQNHLTIYMGDGQLTLCGVSKETWNSVHGTYEIIFGTEITCPKCREVLGFPEPGAWEEDYIPDPFLDDDAQEDLGGDEPCKELSNVERIRKGCKDVEDRLDQTDDPSGRELLYDLWENLRDDLMRAEFEEDMESPHMKAHYAEIARERDRGGWGRLG